MIYASGLHSELYISLLAHLPANSIMRLGNEAKIRRKLKEGDSIILFNWGASGRNLQRWVLDNFKDVHTYPDFELSLRLGSRGAHLEELQQITQYNLKREHYKNATGDLIEYTVPALDNSGKAVVKFGDNHQGTSKYLKHTNTRIRSREDFVIEEFVPDARSIRILLMTGADDDTFIVEHIDNPESIQDNTETWIKNIDPLEKVYTYSERYDTNIEHIDAIITDARKIMSYYNTTYVGIDYVVGEKTGLLEINDMIGLPDDERVYDCAKKYWKSKLERM